MDQEKDTCPISPTGEHRYFVFKAVEVFEPYYFSVAAEVDPATIATINSLPPLYRKIEYATLGCNCGSAIKTEVKSK